MQELGKGGESRPLRLSDRRGQQSGDSWRRDKRGSTITATNATWFGLRAANFGIRAFSLIPLLDFLLGYPSA